MAIITVPVYNKSGKEIGKQELNPIIFNVALSNPLLNQVVAAQRANSRQVLAHTKGRGDVRGGGKKPWKQKGTGRARHGSIRSPLWVGGGITFGPTKERNLTQRINVKRRKKALRMILTDKVASERFIVIDEYGAIEPKTKLMAGLLNNLPSKGKKTALVTTTTDKNVITASRNLPNVQSLGVGSLNPYDLLKNEYIVISQALVKALEERYSK